MKKSAIYSFIIILSIFLTFSCRTMQLNQTAKIIDKNKKEILFSGGIGLSGNSLSSLGLDSHLLSPTPVGLISYEFQSRFGYTKNIEFQLKGRSDFSCNFIKNFFFETHNSLYFIPKFNIYSKNENNVAILPHVSISLLFSNNVSGIIPLTTDNLYRIDLEPHFGFSLISSHDNIYYGFTTNIRQSPFKLVTMYQLNIPSYPLFGLDLTLAFGFETLSKVIYRNEFYIFANFDFTLEDIAHFSYGIDNADYGYVPKLSVFNFGVGYSFSVAKELNKKNK
ncbi:MAG TPA: hypothetical protein PK771_05530 [Spirochaetota bacterium]|nr:hypothetical protein [Spirochaetota bacterium]